MFKSALLYTSDTFAPGERRANAITIADDCDALAELSLWDCIKCQNLQNPDYASPLGRARCDCPVRLRKCMNRARFFGPHRCLWTSLRPIFALGRLGLRFHHCGSVVFSAWDNAAVQLDLE